MSILYVHYNHRIIIYYSGITKINTPESGQVTPRLCSKYYVLNSVKNPLENPDDEVLDPMGFFFFFPRFKTTEILAILRRRGGRQESGFSFIRFGFLQVFRKEGYTNACVLFHFLEH